LTGAPYEQSTAITHLTEICSKENFYFFPPFLDEYDVKW